MCWLVTLSFRLSSRDFVKKPHKDTLRLLLMNRYVPQNIAQDAQCAKLKAKLGHCRTQIYLILPSNSCSLNVRMCDVASLRMHSIVEVALLALTMTCFRVVLLVQRSSALRNPENGRRVRKLLCTFGVRACSIVLTLLTTTLLAVESLLVPRLDAAHRQLRS